MNKKEFKELLDLSKRMVVEYYNRYVHNVEPDMADIKINTDNVELINKSLNSDDVIELTLKVDIDIWLEYHVEYNPNGEDKISSYITLS